MQIVREEKEEDVGNSQMKDKRMTEMRRKENISKKKMR